MQGRKAVEKVGGKVGYINLCCIKGRKLLVIGPPYYEVYPEQVVAVQGSPSKQRQLAMDREQARLWRRHHQAKEDKELRNKFTCITMTPPWIFEAWACECTQPPKQPASDHVSGNFSQANVHAWSEKIA